MTKIFKYATLLILIFWALGTQLLKTDGVIHLFLIIGIYASALIYTSERAWKKRKAQAPQSNSWTMATTNMVELTEVPNLLFPRPDDYSSRLVQLLPNNLAQSDDTSGNQPSATPSTREVSTSLFQNQSGARHWLGEKVQKFCDRHPATYHWVSFWLLKKMLKYRKMESLQVEYAPRKLQHYACTLCGERGFSADNSFYSLKKNNS